MTNEIKIMKNSKEVTTITLMLCTYQSSKDPRAFDEDYNFVGAFS